ncbi:hypothetical protein B296_00010394 [Ensete ventricosum]|uniref:Uncharacterized protein n=1 Tax=Ensete ventricosum TaxID=4639 RepID=A0A427B3C5_ENSVE|nr:hypothetical protein B296_00010394 [Ensete ventricosum]
MKRLPCDRRVLRVDPDPTGLSHLPAPTPRREFTLFHWVKSLWAPMSTAGFGISNKGRGHIGFGRDGVGLRTPALAMEKNKVMVCAAVGFLGLLSAALGFAVEATRIKVLAYRDDPF